MEINYKLAAYVLFTVGVGLLGVMWFFRSQRAIGAIIYLILSILIFVFFGLRLFADSTTNSTMWPPVINTCPDYLTSYERVKGTGQKELTCIDLIGVSSNGALKKWDAAVHFTSPPTDDSYYFNPVASTTAGGDSVARQLCNRSLEAGLTWEGICDGENCYEPIVPGSTAAKGKSGCPA
jgi:hypothetical protein